MRAFLGVIVLSVTTLAMGCGEDRRPGGGGTVPGFDGGGGTTGARSGISGAKTLSSLTTTELRRLCQWAIDLQGGPGRSTDCGDGLSVNTGTVDQCTSSLPTSGCPATVREAEDCIFAIAEDPCNGFGDARCRPLLECGGS